MSKNKKIRLLIKALAYTLTALLLFSAVNRLLIPKYMTGIYEGALIAEYYRSEKEHDILILGDCEVYENISPVTLWEEYGITSYIRGSPQQMIWQSYYLLEDTLRYEKPKVAVLSVLAMKNGRSAVKEEYNRLTLDGMCLSDVKLRAVQSSRLPDESYASYLFPLLRYHDRWSGLTSEDYKYLLKQTEAVSVNGYMPRCDVKPVSSLPSVPVLSNYNLDTECFEYLDKFVKLCRENGVEPVLFKAPTLYPHWYNEWDSQMAAYAEENDVLYINCLETAGEAGIDYTTDTYDAGLHLNVYGAEKFSRYLGKLLIERYNLTDNRSDERLAEIWTKKAVSYDLMKEAQLRDIEEYGKVLTFLIPEGTK